MSKSYNMAGWRVGFCCGNAEMVKALATIKGYYDYGMFAADPDRQRHRHARVRRHARRAEPSSTQKRRDVVCRGLDKLGWTYDKPARQHVRLGEDQPRSTSSRTKARSISACA